MKTILGLLPIAAILAFQAPTIAAPAVCTFDRTKGDNAIGARNGFSIRQNDNNTVAIYDSLPSSSGVREVTISSSRKLTFYNTPIAAARENSSPIHPSTMNSWVSNLKKDSKSLILC